MHYSPLATHGVATDAIIGRRPRPTASCFADETSPAVIEQLVRADFVCRLGLGSDADVLDLGCGTGYTCRFLRVHGRARTVIGAEVDPTLVSDNTLHERDRSISYVTYDGWALPFASGSFGAVFCFEVLEHLPHDGQMQLVAEAARVLRPDGVAVFSTPNRPVYSPSGRTLNPDHVRELDSDEFTTLLRGVFYSCELWGQRYTSSVRLLTRQMHQLASGCSARPALQRIGIQRLVRSLRRFKKPPRYATASTYFQISRGVGSDAFVQLGVCRHR